MTGRHATGPWRPRNELLAAVYGVTVELSNALADLARTFTHEPPAAVPATAIAGSFPRAAGPIDAPYRRGVVDRAAAGPNPAAAPIDRIVLNRSLDAFRASIAQGIVSHDPRTARSHINAGS